MAKKRNKPIVHIKNSKFKKKEANGHQTTRQRARKKKPAPYQLHDKFFLLAKKEGYRARSVYKLKEIQEQFELIEEGMDVCDI